MRVAVRELARQMVREYETNAAPHWDMESRVQWMEKYKRVARWA